MSSNDVFFRLLIVYLCLTQRPTPPTGHVNEEFKRYPFYHFSSSSDGSLVTLDKKGGAFRWKLTLKHPVVAMYRYENEQLFKVAFQVFSAEALAGTSKQNPYKHLYKQQKDEEKQLSLEVRPFFRVREQKRNPENVRNKLGKWEGKQI